jgi:membrane protein DedA with SNARE-associated domain
MAEPIPPPTVPARLTRATWALVGVLTIASVAGTAASPLLLVKAPLLLVALAPDGRHVALAAGRVNALLLLSVGVARQTLYGLGVYGLGAIYGDLAVRWVEARARRVGRALRALERLFERVGALLLLVLPLLAVCVLAGAARVRWVVVLPALVLGHCLWTGISFWLGTHFAEQSQRVVDFFTTRLLLSTLVCCVLVVGQQYLRRRRRAAERRNQ